MERSPLVFAAAQGLGGGNNTPMYLTEFRLLQSQSHRRRHAHGVMMMMIVVTTAIVVITLFSKIMIIVWPSSKSSRSVFSGCVYGSCCCCYCSETLLFFSFWLRKMLSIYTLLHNQTNIRVYVRFWVGWNAKIRFSIGKIKTEHGFQTGTD